MTTAVHGGFDQVFEISAAYVAEQVRQRVVVTDALVDVNTPAQQISGTIEARIHDVWLATPAQVFRPDSGRWVAAGARSRAPQLVVALELDSDRARGTGLTVRKLTVTVGGNPIPLTVPADKQYLDLHAGVAVRVPVLAEPLHTRAAATDPFPANPVPCVALATPPADPARPDVPGVAVDVVVDETRLKACPFVRWLLDLAAAARLDPEKDVMVPLRAELAKQVTAEVHEQLRTTTDPLVQEPQRLLLYSATDPAVTRVDVLVDPESIRVLLTLGGTGGDAALITASILAGPTDALGICVNGTSLLRDVLRPVLEGIFVNLDDGDFLENEPCTVDKRVLVTLDDKDEVVLTYLQAGVDESEDLVLWWQMEVEWAATKVLVEVEVPVTLSVQRALTETAQALSIVPKIGPADYAALAMTPVPLWGQLVQGVVSGAIGSSLKRFKAPNPFNQPLPAGTELRVNGYTLHQDDAPRGVRTEPGTRLIGKDFGPDLGLADLIITTADPVPRTPARWRDHDLVVRLGSRSYPKQLVVGCAVPDSDDADSRIDSLGGTYTRNGRPVQWAMSIDDAVAHLRGGGTMVVAPGTPEEATVSVVEGSSPYLRTSRDSPTDNNLAALPRCTGYADAQVFDPVGTPTRTLLSDTRVHWRDVVPTGERDDEILNGSAKVPSGCKVIAVLVELVDRDGRVLASAGPGGEATVPGAGAAIVESGIGGRSLAVKVHWWFDAYHACRYRVRYTVSGTTC